MTFLAALSRTWDSLSFTSTLRDAHFRPSLEALDIREMPAVVVSPPPVSPPPPPPVTPPIVCPPAPITTCNPWGPSTPCNPVAPTPPCTPVTPVSPVAPGHPVAPTPPCNSGTPTPPCGTVTCGSVCGVFDTGCEEFDHLCSSVGSACGQSSCGPTVPSCGGQSGPSQGGCEQVSFCF